MLKYIPYSGITFIKRRLGEGTYCILKYLPDSFCLKQILRWRQKGKQKADGKDQS